MNIYAKNTYLCIALILLSAANTFTAETSPTILWPQPPAAYMLTPDGKAIYRKYIFEWLTGKTEQAFVDEFKKTGVLPKLPDETQALMNRMHDSHSYPTVGKLRESVKDKLSDDNKGTFSITMVDVVEDPDDRDKIDIGSLQAQHPGAVFQTASRPNGLEGA